MDNLVVNAVAPWKGHLHWLGNIREGVGKNNNEYAFADFTLKYTDSKMQEKFITFSIGDVEKVQMLKGLEIGTPLKVFWVPDTAEDQQRDRWYPSLRAYNVSVVEEAKPADTKVRRPDYPQQSSRGPIPTPEPPLPKYEGPAEPNPDDLPF